MPRLPRRSSAVPVATPVPARATKVARTTKVPPPQSKITAFFHKPTIDSELSLQRATQATLGVPARITKLQLLPSPPVPLPHLAALPISRDCAYFSGWLTVTFSSTTVR